MNFSVLGNRVRKAREEIGLGPAAAALSAGVREKTLQMIEAGRAKRLPVASLLMVLEAVSLPAEIAFSEKPVGESDYYHLARIRRAVGCLPAGDRKDLLRKFLREACEARTKQRGGVGRTGSSGGRKEQGAEGKSAPKCTTEGSEGRGA